MSARRTGRARVAAVLGAAVVGAGLLAGCGAGDDYDHDDDEAVQQLTVFAAASLTDAFTEIAEQFEEANPGVDVRLSFDGSSGLVDQIAAGAPADVFASADSLTMDRAELDGLVSGEPQPFATNVLTLITPPGNPAEVTGFDSSLDGTRLVICAVGTPCGNTTHTLSSSAFLPLEPVSEESKVTDVRGKVESGEADAGIVYATDAAAAGDRVHQIPIPAAERFPNLYPIAVTGDAAEAELAQQFVDTVTGATGQAVLASHGFGAP